MDKGFFILETIQGQGQISATAAKPLVLEPSDYIDVRTYRLECTKRRWFGMYLQSALV